MSNSKSQACTSCLALNAYATCLHLLQLKDKLKEALFVHRPAFIYDHYIMLASLRLPNGRCCCSVNCAAATLFLFSCSAAMAASGIPAIAMQQFGLLDLECVYLICTQLPACKWHLF